MGVNFNAVLDPNVLQIHSRACCSIKPAVCATRACNISRKGRVPEYVLLNRSSRIQARSIRAGVGVVRSVWPERLALGKVIEDGFHSGDAATDNNERDLQALR